MAGCRGWIPWIRDLLVGQEEWVLLEVLGQAVMTKGGAQSVGSELDLTGLGVCVNGKPEEALPG